MLNEDIKKGSGFRAYWYHTASRSRSVHHVRSRSHAWR